MWGKIKLMRDVKVGDMVYMATVFKHPMRNGSWIPYVKGLEVVDIKPCPGLSGDCSIFTLEHDNYPNDNITRYYMKAQVMEIDELSVLSDRGYWVDKDGNAVFDDRDIRDFFTTRKKAVEQIELFYASQVRRNQDTLDMFHKIEEYRAIVLP